MTDRSRAQRLFDQVQQGKVVFFKAGDAWDILGPAEDIQPGQKVTVTKASGETTQVVVTEIMVERTVRGVATRTARFVRAGIADSTTERHAPERPRPVYNVVDRQAATVGGMLGRTSTSVGYCHYCGLELNRSGNCAECV